MMRILLLIIIFSFDINFLFAQYVRIDRLATKQGLSHGSVTSIMQDREGYLWFGTPNGLNRYDGYSFKVFSRSTDDTASLPNNIIRTIYQDKKGNLWLGIDNNGLIQFNPFTGEYIQYKHDSADPNSLSHNDVYAIYVDKQDNFWIGTYGGGLNLFNPSTGKFNRFEHSSQSISRLSDNYILALHMDESRKLWIGTEKGGLNKFDPASQRFTNYYLPQQKKKAPIWAVCEDKAGYLWLATDGHGLLKFDKQSEKFEAYTHNPANANSLSHDNLTAMIADKKGMLWVGTWGGGLNKFDPQTGLATHYTYHPYLPDKLSSSTVYTLFEDKSGLIWIGTNGHGINKLSPSGASFQTYTYDPAQPDGLSDNAVRAILEDKPGNVWVGTNGSGLDYFNLNTGKARHYVPNVKDKTSISGLSVIALCKDKSGNLWAGTYENGLNKLNPKTNEFTHYQHNPEDSNSLSDNRVLTLLEDDGYIWVGTFEEGLDRLNPQTGRFEHFRHSSTNQKSISSNGIRCLYKDSKGNIWIGTKNGLNLLDKKNYTFRHFIHNPNDAQSISNNGIRCVYEDMNGILWVGTSEGGLNRYDPKTGKFSSLKQKDGMPDNGVYGILGDMHSNLWISTNKGIAKYSIAQNKFTIYDEGDGLVGNEYSVGGYHLGESGKMYFGTFKGLNVFSPDSIQDNKFIPPVVVTDFKVSNVSRPELLTQRIIELSYQQNSLSFEFAALSFDEPEQNQYAYQLTGVDTNWVYSGTRRFISYTNLKGGNYTFKVKAANSDGLWNNKGLLLNIYIEPPLWEVRWFRACMALLIGGFVFIIYKVRVQNIKLQNKKLEELVIQRTEELRQRSIQLEQSLMETRQQKLEADHQRKLAEEANRIKTELTNITIHDLKNPLGGIMMYTNLVKESLHDPDKVGRLIHTIKETSQNMFHLISNLLRRTKLESTYINLQKDITDISLLAKAVVERNKPQAIYKKQELLFSGQPGCCAYVDLDLMNDLIENLVSNAIKFTPMQKTIRIQVRSIEQFVQIRVIDEGLGFRKDELNKLFRPFQRLSAKPTGGESSTGLGLSIVYQIVQLHGGTIHLESEGPHKGSTFTVTIPQIEADQKTLLNPDEYIKH